MSTKGIYTAVSGAIAQDLRVDTIANNIANTNTPAFKKSKQVFEEYLTAHEKLPDIIQVPKIPASIESFYDMQGGDRSYVNSAGSYTDFSQGTLKTTGSPFDLAIEGDAFFEVLSPQGVRLTRDGSFRRDVGGRLVNQNGFPVLKTGTGEPESRIINLNSSNMVISYDGKVVTNGEDSGELAVVKVANKDALQAVGKNMYAVKPNYNATLEVPDEFKVHQGVIEGSNVNVVDEMTDLISANRVFETTQTAIKAFDNMDGRLINEVPKLR